MYTCVSMASSTQDILNVWMPKVELGGTIKLKAETQDRTLLPFPTERVKDQSDKRKNNLY